MAADAFVVIDAVAAAVQDEPAPVNLYRAGVVGGVAVDDVNTAIDQPAGKADLVLVHAIPQLDPQWIDTMTTSPRCLTACIRAITSSAAAPERPGRSTPGRVTVAAQPGGIPLDAAPHKKIIAREREERVRWLQYLLNAHGHGLRSTGRFGPKTKTTVVGLQRSRSLAGTGVVYAGT